MTLQMAQIQHHAMQIEDEAQCIHVWNMRMDSFVIFMI